MMKKNVTTLLQAIENEEQQMRKLRIKVRNIVSYLRNDILKRFPEFKIVFETPNSYLEMDTVEFYGLTRKEIIYKLLTLDGAYAVIEYEGSRYKLYNPAMAYVVLTDLLDRNRRYKVSYMRTGKKDFRYYTNENLFLLYKGCENCKLRKIK